MDNLQVFPLWQEENRAEKDLSGKWDLHVLQRPQKA
jgi:hypothetical protein